MDIYKELSKFKPIDLNDQNADLDASNFDNFIKIFTKIAKNNQKIKQTVDFSFDEITNHLKQNEEIYNTVKKEKAHLKEENEILIRVLLETMDIITNFKKTSLESKNTELLSIANTMMKSVDNHINNIGLNRISCIGETPDAMLHFVRESKKVTEADHKNRIIDIIREGYTFNGRIIRKADVIVGK